MFKISQYCIRANRSLGKKSSGIGDEKKWYWSYVNKVEEGKEG